MALEIAQPKCFDLLRRSPLDEAIAQLPSDLLDDETVVKYQRTHLPHGAWHSNQGVAGQVTGRNRFPLSEEDESPI
ncbi:MAG: hypothetical protein D6680_06995 [Cyanobacteria bacterium J007]|nr:MAG: hypothetical protein D6680_06995 [Cyanobacteria bacterium J007]